MTWRGSPRVRAGDQGAATLLTVSVIAAIAVLAFTTVMVGAAGDAQSRAASAADAAALAAGWAERDARALGARQAVALATGCREATRVSALNGATLVACRRAQGTSIQVRVVVPGPLGTTATATARAGAVPRH